MTPGEFDDFVELVGHPAFVLAAGRITAANSRLSRFTGYSKSELLGMRSKGLLSAGDSEHDAEPSRMRAVTLGDRNTVLVKKDGQRVPVRLVTRRLNQGGRSGGMLTIFDEATEQDSNGICTPDGEGLLEECLRAAEAGVVVIGRNGLVALVNRKCCELLGYQDLEMIGRPWAGGTPPQAV